MFAVGILEAFSKTEIDDENIVFVCVVSADQEIVGLNISVNNAFFVNLLNALNLFNIYIQRTLLVTIWIAMHKTVLRSNFLLHSWNRSSRLLPRRSITITW